MKLIVKAKICNENMSKCTVLEHSHINTSSVELSEYDDHT